MSVRKRRQQAINRRQWVADMRDRWDALRAAAAVERAREAAEERVVEGVS